jgi:hypothetical protein
MLTIQLQGGLGNQLFQLAALEYYSNTTGLPIFISEKVTPKTYHSNQNYYDSIFLNWKPLYNNKSVDIHVGEEDPKFNTSKINCLHGYFQDYTLVTELFLSKLVLNTAILTKYPDIHTTVFLHIRGGDYINNPVHDLHLNEYYSRAISQFKNDKFSVFTNDKEYAKRFLGNINYNFVDENELDSLTLMSKCKAGICANSSFSWWGAYLNRNRPIYMPSKWTTRKEYYKWGNYYFSGVITIDI